MLNLVLSENQIYSIIILKLTKKYIEKLWKSKIIKNWD